MAILSARRAKCRPNAAKVSLPNDPDRFVLLAGGADNPAKAAWLLRCCHLRYSVTVFHIRFLPLLIVA